jgi:hypothetical protein
MTQISRLRAAANRYFATAQAAREARQRRAQLVSALSGYSTQRERAEMDAILGRHTETETHRAWNSMSPVSSRSSWARA